MSLTKTIVASISLSAALLIGSMTPTVSHANKSNISHAQCKKNLQLKRKVGGNFFDMHSALACMNHEEKAQKRQFQKSRRCKTKDLFAYWYMMNEYAKREYTIQKYMSRSRHASGYERKRAKQAMFELHKVMRGAQKDFVFYRKLCKSS